MAGKIVLGADARAKQFAARYGVKKKDLDPLRISHHTQDEVSTALGFPAKAGGFLIPYFDIHGKTTGRFRIRYDDHAPPWSWMEIQRYVQPSGSGIAAYFAPLVDWAKIAADNSVRLLLTEGEMKGAAACARDLPCIAFGGVDSWRGTKVGLRLLPELNEFDWRERPVVVVFDSDKKYNPNVVRAENAIAREMVNLGASVRVVRLPPQDNGKVGLDDYLLAQGKDALVELIEATPEWALSRELAELSASYGFIHDTALIVEYPSERRPTPLLFKPETFMNHVEVARKVRIDPATGALATSETERAKVVSASRFWFEAESRPTYRSLTYEPGCPPVTDDNKLNTWRPSGVEPCDGDTSPWEELIGHLVPNERLREELERCFAAPLQTPGLRLNYAVVMVGAREGTGKTLIGDSIGRLHGSNYLEVTQAELESEFNSWQAHKTFVMGSELCGDTNSRKFADRLKTMITGETILVNQKYQPVHAVPNCSNYYLTSNHANAVFVGEHARRFFVIDTEAEPLSARFYANLVHWRDNGGLSALYHRLLTLDLTGFNAKGHAPLTAAREDMIAASRTLVQEWVHELKHNTDTALSVGDVTVRGQFFTTRELLRVFTGGERSQLTEKGMADALRAAGFKKTEQVRIPNTDQKLRLWIVREPLRAANMSPGEIGAAYKRQSGPVREVKYARR